MPTSFVGLLLFVVLLAPGFAFVVRRETQFVPRTASVFRETAAVVLASVAVNSAVLVLLGAVRAALPALTPDVGAIVRSPHDYFENHFTVMAGWTIGLLAVACGLAAIAAVPPPWLVKKWRKLPKSMQPAWLEELGNPIVYKSAWDKLMHLRPDDDPDGDVTVWISCELLDGTWLGGELFSLNPDINEDADRDLILKAPVQRRGADSTDAEDLDVGAVSISARNVKYVAWSYLTAEPDPASIIDPE